MSLAEGVPARDQSDRFFVVHRHPAKCLANIACRQNRIGITVRSFRIHINKAHLDGTERLGKLALAAVTLVAKPRTFRSPEELLRLPRIFPAAGKAERLESHVLKRNVADQHKKVGPRDLASVFLLDRPEQASGLIEICVIRPAVKWCETHLSCSGAAPAVRDAIGTRTMPGEANEQSAVVAEIRRPPVLRVGHQRLKIVDHRIEIERLELRGIIKILAHRVRHRRVLSKDRQIQTFRPPVAVRPSAAGRVLAAAAERALRTIPIFISVVSHFSRPLLICLKFHAVGACSP